MPKPVKPKRPPGRPPTPMDIEFVFLERTPENEVIHAKTFRDLVELGRRFRREEMLNGKTR